MPIKPVRTGLEVLLDDPGRYLGGAPFGLLTHQAALDSRCRFGAELLAQRLPRQLKALFSPQHGLFGEKQDNMVESPHGRFLGKDLPLYSLYSETRRPTAPMLEGLEALVIDLQDVGCRVYTYAWTVSLCLEACAERGIAVVVLDRPHPLGGEAAEGAPLESGFESFVGRHGVPLAHELTLGELTALLNEAMDLGADLAVVPCQDWEPGTDFTATGLPWIPPSPNLPRLEGVRVYPGQVVLEGTNLSEGRGTTTPFEMCGAPFVDALAWRERARSAALPGVELRPVRFEPTFGKWAGEECEGLFLHVTERRAFRPVRTGLALIAAAFELWPGLCQWRAPPYEYEFERPPVDLITGSARFREAVAAGTALCEEVLGELCDPGVDWARRAAAHRLYGGRGADSPDHHE